MVDYGNFVDGATRLGEEGQRHNQIQGTWNPHLWLTTTTFHWWLSLIHTSRSPTYVPVRFHRSVSVNWNVCSWEHPTLASPAILCLCDKAPPKYMLHLCKNAGAAVDILDVHNLGSSVHSIQKPLQWSKGTCLRQIMVFSYGFWTLLCLSKAAEYVNSN